MALRKCVLIVEDNLAVRRSLRHLFEAPGWDVCGEAENGNQAISKAQELLPALVILDLAMPGINGLTVAKILKEGNPEIRIILFTLHGDLLTEQQLRTAGISALVSKADPSAARTLLREAEKLLNETAA